MLLPALLAARLLLPASPALAEGSLGGDYTTGQGYRGYDFKGDLDLNAKATYSVNAQYAHVHSTVGTETKSNEISLGVDHTVEDDWDIHATLTGWKDDISDVKYAGPSLGFAYTAYRDGGPGSSWTRDERDEAARDPADEAFVVAYNSDFFYYETGVNASSETIHEGRGKAAKALVVPPLDSTVNLFQFHPSLEVDVPLFRGKVTPAVQAGHYFYSKNPELIEERAGDPYYAASAGGLNGLVGGLFLNNAQVGVSLALPGDLRLRATLGVEQLASDNSWATTQGAALTGVLVDLVRVNLGWSRSIQDGVPQDLFTAGAAVVF